MAYIVGARDDFPEEQLNRYAWGYTYHSVLFRPAGDTRLDERLLVLWEGKLAATLATSETPPDEVLN